MESYVCKVFAGREKLESFVQCGTENSGFVDIQKFILYN